MIFLSAWDKLPFSIGLLFSHGCSVPHWHQVDSKAFPPQACVPEWVWVCAQYLSCVVCVTFSHHSNMHTSVTILHRQSSFLLFGKRFIAFHATYTCTLLVCFIIAVFRKHSSQCKVNGVWNFSKHLENGIYSCPATNIYTGPRMTKFQ